MNEKKPTWICPVCDKKAAYESLIIDGLVIPVEPLHRKTWPDDAVLDLVYFVVSQVLCSCEINLLTAFSSIW